MNIRPRSPLALLAIGSLLFDIASPYTERTALTDIEYIFAL